MIRVCLADDHRLLREGVRRLLEDAPDIRVAVEAASGDEVRNVLDRAEVDVLLLDLSMPGIPSLDLLAWCRGTHPRVRTLILSAHGAGDYALRCLRAGAAGYLVKDHSPDLLVEAVRRVARGERYLTPDVAALLAEEAITPGGALGHRSLSDRELAVLRLLAEGRSVKETGALLEVSPKTVSTYRARVLEKLGLETNADLVRYALQHGLLRRGP